MANPLQRAVLRRQITYIGIILALFTVSLFWRGKIPLPLADDARIAAIHESRRSGDASRIPAARSAIHALADRVASRSIEEQASPDALELREIDRGDPEVGAAAVRLALTGSRGLAVTVLWRMAIEKQKRNEFHEFEQLVKNVTRLQPNFITPWIYQSWNIAYNVSVENDRLNDTYYYIARGIELLAEGERLNHNSPDMRYQIAFYYQNKFSVSDKVITLRSLFQLSNIKPGDRNPDLLRDRETRKIDMDRYREFVRANPQLCRRLREKLNYTRPEQVIDFLASNQRVPTRFDKDKQDKLLDPRDQFPVLPPGGTDDYKATTIDLTDTFDALLAARSWYEYSLDVIPPPSAEPTTTVGLSGLDRFKYRLPKSPMLIIFRQGAPRAQTYYAERLTKEGWFDETTKWYPDERADTPDEFWFPGTRTDGLPGEGLRTTTSSRNEWAKAYDRWKLHGERNGLQLSLEQMRRYEDAARKLPEGIANPSEEQLKALGLTMRNSKAREILRTYEQNRTVTNFPYFLSATEAEQDPGTVTARRLLWEAEVARTAGRRDPAAIRQYADALAAWRQTLLRFPEFHRTDHAEEETSEAMLNLVFMLEDSPETQAKARATQLALQGLVPAATDGSEQDPLRKDLARHIAEREAGVRVALADRRIQSRVTQLFAMPHATPALHNEWVRVTAWVRALAVQQYARETGKPLAASEQNAIADDPKWQDKVAVLLNDPATSWPAVASARDEIARLVLEREYPWLPEYTSDLKDDANRWVRADTERVVKERLNVARPKVVRQDDPTAAPPTPQ